MYRNRIVLTLTLLLTIISGSINAMSDGSEDQKEFEHLISGHQYERARALLVSGEVDVRAISNIGGLMNSTVRPISMWCAVCGKFSCNSAENTQEHQRQQMDQNGQEELHKLIVEMLDNRGPLVEEEQSGDNEMRRDWQENLVKGMISKGLLAVTLRAIFEYGVKPDKMLSSVCCYRITESFLGCALRWSTAEKTRLLLEYGADPQDGQPLNYIGSDTELEAVELLAFWGADPEGALRRFSNNEGVKNAIMRGVEKRKKSMATLVLSLEELMLSQSERTPEHAECQIPPEVMEMIWGACDGQIDRE